ncbi:hypothetical protein LP420_39145 [Massilia sp. B-10]|nr:hypothetical protein LP420_39145 [Massilia sp. B-10]
MTASYGVEGFTDEHLAAFREHGTNRVLIAYDRDEAGRARRRQAGRALDRLRDRLLPDPVPEGDGRQRIRAQGAAYRQEPGGADPQGGVDGASGKYGRRPVRTASEGIAPEQRAAVLKQRCP